MAARMPGARDRHLDGKSTTPLNHHFVNVHTMVGTLGGTESWFTPSGRPYSHYGIGGSGEIREWQDPIYRAASDLEGNPYSVSIETEDKGSFFPSWSGSDVPAWTPNQIDALVDALAWICVRFDIPPVLVPNSLPIPDGLSYHRLGIDPWRVDGGLRYSSWPGKACPGDRRINQFRAIVVPAVAAQVGGGSDMPLNETDKTIIRNIFRQEMYGDEDAHSKGYTAIIRNEVRAVLMELFPDGYEKAFGEAMQAAVGKTNNVDGEAAAQVRARAEEGALEALTIAGLYVPPQ